ncbi:MAG TPA: M1 family aminopeptidase [Thermoanaerobaculia bacterium]
MRFREVFRYELSYRLRSASTWIYAAVLLLLAFWIVDVSADASDVQWTNAPLRVAELSTMLCGLFGLAVTAGLFADAAIRDRNDGMEPLLFTTRIRPLEFVGGRFLANVVVNSMLVVATPLGLALATRMPHRPPEAFGPNHLLAYLQPLLLLILPNVVLTSAILFTIAALSRRAIPVYAGAIAIFTGYVVALKLWSGITNRVLSVLLDPLGINALKGLTQYWTAAERNTTFVGFPAMLLWNRALWLAVAAALFAVTQRMFRFTQREERGGGASAEAPGDERWSGVVPRVEGVFAFRTRLTQTLAVARQSLIEVMSGRAFQVGFVAAMGNVLLQGLDIGSSIYETVTWPVTHLVAGVVVSQRAVAIPWLVITMFAGELVWKDRETGTSQIGDAVPVRSGVALVGRFLSLVTIVVLFQLAMMLGGILLQVLHGYYDFELGLYVRILFGWNLVELVLLAVFAITVHVLVNHKYVAHVVVLLATLFNYESVAEVHNLLVYNSGPALNYSEMNGFGPDVERFVWFKLYWAAWALLLGVVTMLFWVRGPQAGLRQRLATARARFTRRTATVAALAVALIAAFGGFIFYNTNILNEYVPPRLAGKNEAEYEQRYGRYRDLPQPTVTGADLRFEIHPEEGAFDARGSYALVNQSGVPIRSVHVATTNNGRQSVRSMTFDPAAKPELVDREHGYRIFTLGRALAPGESLRFSFDVAFRPRGFEHGGNRTKVVANGSYFDRGLLPFIGYQPVLEVSDEQARKRLGLPARSSKPAPASAGAARYGTALRNDGELIPVETIVGTAPDQTVVVPGMLRRSWSEHGRRYFHYATRFPETFATAVFSARYAVKTARWNDVALQVFHHPPHRANVDRMLGAMKSSLDFYTAAFGAYPYRELRIVEIPPYSVNARAFPAAAALSEANFITRTGPDTLDLTFFGTAHEIAHQWWGGQVRPAYAKGRGLVSEAMANYSAMLVTEKVLGATEARRVYDYQMDRYLRQRGETGRDVPLLEADDQGHVSYGKGAVALYTLREHIGDAAMNAALRRFFARFRHSGPPYATSLDLYAELRAVTPAAHRTLLIDLFETITLWDVKTRSATARRLADGKYEVTLDVLAQKMRSKGTGADTPTPMNDPIEVAVFAAEDDKPLYLARHPIHSGKQTLRLIVPREPSRAGLDPYAKLIERERGDNMVEVEGVTP